MRFTVEELKKATNAEIKGNLKGNFELILPKTATNIKREAFLSCEGLKKIQIGDKPQPFCHFGIKLIVIRSASKTNGCRSKAAENQGNQLHNRKDTQKKQQTLRNSLDILAVTVKNNSCHKQTYHYPNITFQQSKYKRKYCEE